jgi:hypothetical protein
MRNVSSEEIVPHLTSFTYCAEHRKHVTNRAQKLYAVPVFVDFSKAFESPPRSAIWEFLD